MNGNVEVASEPIEIVMDRVRIRRTGKIFAVLSLSGRTTHTVMVLSSVKGHVEGVG